MRARKKKKRVRPSSGQRLGRMSKRIFQANTLAQAREELGRAEFAIRRMESEGDRAQRKELRAEALGRIGASFKFVVDYLVDNRVDVRKLVGEIVAAFEQEIAA